MATNDEITAQVVLVMVPFIAHGHLNQLLHLSRLVSAYHIPVHFVSTTTHLRQLRHRLHPSNHIHFHHFPTPPFTSPPPHPSTSFPTHLQPAFDSTLHLRRPVRDLILSLSNTATRVAVVHDFLMSYVVQDVKLIPNAETYLFHPLSAFHTFWMTWERLGRPFPVDTDMLKRLPSLDNTFSPEFIEFIKLQQPLSESHIGGLIDSSRAVEGEYLEHLEIKEMFGKKKLWAIGLFHHVDNAFATVLENRHKCLQWLDMHPPNSVIYVSFGTTTTFSNHQIKELAIGLERSGVRFVWVARAADKGDVFGDGAKAVELPNGFEERVEGRGVVVRDWVPQMEILGHLATGGFMSHCGWNSCMESISMGVPMLTWPMHSDQPLNAFLITDVVKMGLSVKDWGRKEELVTWQVVEDCVRRLTDSKEGEELQRRAAELGGAVRSSVAEGGVCQKEIDSFVSYIKRQR